MPIETRAPLGLMVRKLAYWGDFDAADEQAILALPNRIKRIERNGYIVRERDETTHSSLLLSGFATQRAWPAPLGWSGFSLNAWSVWAPRRVRPLSG